jgi:hypothetical protein
VRSHAASLQGLMSYQEDITRSRKVGHLQSPRVVIGWRHIVAKIGVTRPCGSQTKRETLKFDMYSHWDESELGTTWSIDQWYSSVSWILSCDWHWGTPQCGIQWLDRDLHKYTSVHEDGILSLLSNHTSLTNRHWWLAYGKMRSSINKEIGPWAGDADTAS